MKPISRFFLVLILPAIMMAAWPMVQMVRNENRAREIAEKLEAFPDYDRVSGELTRYIPDSRQQLQIFSKRSGWKNGEMEFAGEALKLDPDFAMFANETAVLGFNIRHRESLHVICKRDGSLWLTGAGIQGEK